MKAQLRYNNIVWVCAIIFHYSILFFLFLKFIMLQNNFDKRFIDALANPLLLHIYGLDFR